MTSPAVNPAARVAVVSRIAKASSAAGRCGSASPRHVVGRVSSGDELRSHASAGAGDKYGDGAAGVGCIEQADLLA